MPPRRHRGPLRLGRKPGVIPDDAGLGLRVARRQDGSETSRSSPGSLPADLKTPPHFPRPLPRPSGDSPPCVLGPIGRRRPHAPQRPALAHHRDQTITVFIGPPQAHPSSTSRVQVRPLCAKRVLERFGGGRVFFARGLARHFQDPAPFSQPVIHTGPLQADRMPLPQPGLANSQPRFLSGFDNYTTRCDGLLAWSPFCQLSNQFLGAQFIFRRHTDAGATL